MLRKEQLWTSHVLSRTVQSPHSSLPGTIITRKFLMTLPGEESVKLLRKVIIDTENNQQLYSRKTKPKFYFFPGKTKLMYPPLELFLFSEFWSSCRYWNFKRKHCKEQYISKQNSINYFSFSIFHLWSKFVWFKTWKLLCRGRCSSNMQIADY